MFSAKSFDWKPFEVNWLSSQKSLIGNHTRDEWKLLNEAIGTYQESFRCKYDDLLPIKMINLGQACVVTSASGNSASETCI